MNIERRELDLRILQILETISRAHDPLSVARMNLASFRDWLLSEELKQLEEEKNV